MNIPKKEFWDVLLTETKTPGYHFEDYEELSQFDPPEWSHLSTPDAKLYTRNIISIMLKDQVIPNLK